MERKDNPDRSKEPALDPEQGPGNFAESLRMFRESVRASAERPAFFWTRQRNTILARINKPAPSAKFRALVWAPAALVVFLCLFLLVENSKAPPPDLAAGSDQILLIEVERALNQDYPEALAPAAVFNDEIKKK